MTQIEYSGRDNLDVMKAAVNYNQFLINLITSAMPKQGTVVDFGAGSGTFSAPAKKAGLDVVCVETDSVLGQSLRTQGFNVLSDLRDSPQQSVAGIYSLNVLEHIEDDQAILNMWMEKLKPGGKVLIYVPAFQSIYSSMDQKVGHHRRYRSESLRQKLQYAGFEIDRMQYADSIGYLASWVYKLLDKGNGEIDPSMLRIYDRWIFPISLACDKLFSRWFGKNVYAVAHKPVSTT